MEYLRFLQWKSILFTLLSYFLLASFIVEKVNTTSTQFWAWSSVFQRLHLPCHTCFNHIIFVVALPQEQVDCELMKGDFYQYQYYHITTLSTNCLKTAKIYMTKLSDNFYFMVISPIKCCRGLLRVQSIGGGGRANIFFGNLIVIHRLFLDFHFI